VTRNGHQQPDLCDAQYSPDRYDALMPHDPLREWQERYSRSGTRLGFKPETDVPFYSSVESICNSPRIVRSTLSPGVLFRDGKMVRDGDDNVSLVVSLGRALSVSHRKREACLARNEAIIMQADAPGSAGTRQRFAVLEVSIAQREWDSRNANPGDVLMNVINRNSQALALLLGYIRALAKTGLPSAAKALHLVSRHLIDLVILAATEPPLGESHIDCVIAARRAAMIEYITSHFCDPNLSGSCVAKRLGISQRYLQRLLEATGKTFTEHVNELRLDRAFLLLVTGGADKRVSDIALEVGYSDLTNFYRHFKSRFGDSPKGVAGSSRADKSRTR
jgi:AraC-like DNA-binding protein